MPDARLLFAATFDGAGYPDFAVEWPGFEWPTASGVNQVGWARPVVDGYGKGIPSRTISGVTWRARATTMPGRADYQADLWCRWKNPAGAARREVGIIVRFVDAQNFVVARLRSMGSASPELRLFKVLAGVETQLGSTYTGTGISSTDLFGGVRWRVRVQDLADGTTRVTVYTGSAGASSKGTSRIDWTGDLSGLNGAHGVGIELRDQVGGTDVYVDDLEVYDLADEWNPSGGLGDESGWAFVFGGADARSVADLTDLALTETRFQATVQQAYGLKGNALTIRLGGDWREGPTLKPGVRVKAIHGGVVRFDGTIAQGSLSADPGEVQTWQAFDAYWAARQVILQADNGTSALHWNVTDPESEGYDASEQGKTLGEVLAALFDRYLDGASNSLRFYGAAPAIGLPFVQAELDAIDAVIPNLTLSGTFAGAVETILRYVPKWQVCVDPVDGVWHFRDVTDLTAQDIGLTADWVRLRVAPDRDKAFAFVEIRGGRQEDKDPVTYQLRDGSLPPAWTNAQENTWKRGKTHLGTLRGVVTSAGTGTLDGVSRPYFDVAIALGIEEDDWRGAVVSFVGSDSYARFVWKNTGTRFWLTAPAWSPTPSPGDAFALSLTHPDAIPALSAAGVGRAFFFPPTVVCGYPSAAAAGLKNNGACGKALMEATGVDGVVYSQEYQFRVYAMTATQQAAGFCDPLIVVAAPPKPPLALINFHKPAGGSPPSSACVPGNTNKPSQIPQVNVSIQVSELEAEACSLREPEEGFEGDAFEEWGVTQGLVLDDPSFTSMDMEVGLRKAARYVLDLVSQKPYLVEATIATPWSAVLGDRPVAGQTSTWAGLSKRITVSSTRRATGLEALPGLAVFRVTWDILGNTTTIEAGTAAGWLQPEFQAVARAYSEQRLLKKMYSAIQDVEDYRNAMIRKNADRVGGVQGGTTDGCEVVVANENTHLVKDVQEDDQNKEAWINHQANRQRVLDALFGGAVEQEKPGSRIEVPGFDGAAAQQVQDGGPVLASHARHDAPFQGPSTLRNGNRGRYEGLIETDPTLSGSPPREIMRIGGYAFRKALAADGRHGGAAGVEVTDLDEHGAPAGPWWPFRRPSDLPYGGVFPLSRLAEGSVPAQLRDREDALAAQLAAAQDAAGRVLAAGDTSSASYPDGAPASLADIARAGGGLLGPYFRLVAASFSDPGGLVFEGPMTENGASAGLFWRVLAPELVPVRVESVTPGTGTNGGAWDWVTSGPGGAMEYLSNGYVVHKQIHAHELQDDTTDAQRTTQAADDSAFLFAGQHGRTMGAVGISGAGSVIGLPPYARGTPMFTAHVKEDEAGAAGPTLVISGYLEYQYRSSPWAAAATTTPAPVVTGDGTQTGTGIYRAPGGAVPTGLRKPLDLAIGFHRTPGANGDNHPGGGVLTGIDVEVAVVEGGYLVRFGEDLEGTEAWVDSAPRFVEYPLIEDAWKIEPGKVLTEALDVLESWTVEGSAPIALDEGVALEDAWMVEAS